MSKNKFRVYLAGPISGCSDIQANKWRNEVKEKYGAFLDFIDPTDGLKATSYEIVQADIDAIEAADGLLVNMWRESIGSAIGIVHAHRAGRPVVVANPNYLSNSILEFYAAAIEETPLKAANVLLHILRANANWRVMKSGDRDDESFCRDKLADSIRAVCRSAKRNNIVVPALVLPRVIEHLRKGDRKWRKHLATADINQAVIASLAELEADPAYALAVKGVLAKWKSRHAEKHPQLPASQSKRRTPSESPVDVKIYSVKSHGTLWGKAVKKLGDVKSSNARRAFKSIMKVSGITRITLGAFGHKEKRSSFGVAVSASKQASIIEGKMFDKGEKGTMQSFQVRVQHASSRGSILEDIIKLIEKNGWSG